MDPDVIAQIRSINSKFYQTFAESFSDTRGRLQPGVQRLLPLLSESERLLDLGCGNGTLAARLLEHDFRGTYLGLDLSEEMLAIARQTAGESESVEFLPVELGASELESVINASAPESFHPPYDRQVAFATLHHIPDTKARADLARELRGMLVPRGMLIVSVWNFLDSPRLRERILPWDSVGLSEDQVEQGDYLVDWRRGGAGVRYVHYFTEDSLSSLAQDAGFSVVETFYSDGETGRLGLYQTWQA